MSVHTNPRKKLECSWFWFHWLSTIGQCEVTWSVLMLPLVWEVKLYVYDDIIGQSWVKWCEVSKLCFPCALLCCRTLPSDWLENWVGGHLCCRGQRGWLRCGDRVGQVFGWVLLPFQCANFNNYLTMWFWSIFPSQLQVVLLWTYFHFGCSYFAMFNVIICTQCRVYSS